MFSINREEYATGLTRCRAELNLDAANVDDKNGAPTEAKQNVNKEGYLVARFLVDTCARVVRMARLQGETIDLQWAMREDEQLNN